MKTKLLLILLCLMANMAAFGQTKGGIKSRSGDTQTANAQNSKGKTMAQQENLKGKVKSVYLICDSIDFVKTCFDESGKITRRKSKLGSHGDNYIEIQDNFIYDTANRLLSYVSYAETAPDDTTTWYYEYNGLVKSIKTKGKYDEESYLLVNYEYDAKGNRILDNYTYPSAAFDKIKRIYNAKNQVIEDWSYRDYPVTIRETFTDDNGHLYEKRSVSESFEGIHTFYEYNEFGYMSHRTQKADTTVVDTITYVYDEKGNWIKRNHSEFFLENYSNFEGISSDGTCLTRIIEYYEQEP
jgi:hypothetical protein